MDLTADRPAPARSLAPREHGAWGQLGVPLVVALAAARPTPAGVALSLAALSLFAAHEPLLVALGHRGARALREDGARARRRLAALVFVGASLGLAGLAAAPAARLACALPVGLALAVGAFIARRAERTAAGVTTAAAALASASLPVMVASGVSPRAGLWAWAAWAVGFALVTPAVRGAIAHARSPSPVARRASALLPPLAALAALAALGPAWSALAAAPFALAALALVAAPPSPRHLKRVGWALVGSSLAAGAALVVALRTS